MIFIFNKGTPPEALEALLPELPAVLAAPMERWFARPASVFSVEGLGPLIRRVSLEVPSLRGATLPPGAVVEFRVDPRCFRHYTVARFSPESGLLDVLFYLHGLGVGSAWASALTVGQPVQLLGPGRGKARVSGSDAVVLLGDDTCLGLAEGLAVGCAQLRGALEVEAAAIEAATIAPGVDVIPRGTRGAGLLRWIREHPPSRDEVICLGGHTGTIAQLRRWLLGEGHPRRQIRVDPYWADGKRGL